MNPLSLYCGIHLKQGDKPCEEYAAPIKAIQDEGGDVDELWLALSKQAIELLCEHTKKHSKSDIRGSEPKEFVKGQPKLNRALSAVSKSFNGDKAKSILTDRPAYLKELKSFTLDEFKGLQTKKDKLRAVRWDYRDEVFSEIHVVCECHSSLQSFAR